MSVLSNLVNNYADDVVRSTVNNYGDDVLKAAYNGIRNYKINTGPKLFERGFDHFGTQDFDYAKLMRDNEKAISDIIGEDALNKLRDNVSGMLEVYPSDYNTALNNAKLYLNDSISDSVARESQKYIKPGTKIYRAANSPYGISWTTDKNVALNSRNNNNVRVLEHILQPDEKYIAPHFTELYNQFTAPQSEVLFNEDIFRK